MEKITEKTSDNTRFSALNNILSKTEKALGLSCLKWKGKLDKSGHGICQFNGKSKRVHRIIMLLKGFDISGKQVLHCCGEPSCCNPDHIFIDKFGSKKSNVKRKKFTPLYSLRRYRISSDASKSARSRDE
jgi:hypothetical protein